jgi:hypothetical protein
MLGFSRMKGLEIAFLRQENLICVLLDKLVRRYSIDQPHFPALLPPVYKERFKPKLDVLIRPDLVLTFYLLTQGLNDEIYITVLAA